VKPLTKAQLARADRKDRVVATAREIAEADGWGAVTVRRLADAIGFSQPVLYGHFPDGRDEIVRAVALDGFARIAVALHASDSSPATGDSPVQARTRGPADGDSPVRARLQGPVTGDSPARARLRRLAGRYLDFARENPAVYEAMFSLPTDLAFATVDTPPELLAGFGALAEAAGGDEIRAEALWSALHGMAGLGGHGRLRAGHDTDRIDLLVELFAPA
jgi:AcrR family transcriptional regulator